MEEKEITLKDLILKLKEYWAIIWSKKIWVISAGIITSLVFGVTTYLKPTIYKAELTFMVNDDEGGGMSGVGAILGQFGLGRGGGKYNYEKITNIGLSNRILSQVIYDSTTIGNSQDLIGNHIIKIYDIHENWEEDTLLNGFYFTNSNNNSYQSNLALSRIISLLRGNPKDPKSAKICAIGFNEESTIMNIQSNSINEDLSVAIANSWYDKLSNFYIQKSTERQEKTYETLRTKADSVYGLLTGSESSLARSSDLLGLVKNTDYLPQARSNRNIQMYSTMYAEIIKNKETAEFILKSETPFFQIIDEPLKPLNKSNNSFLLQIIVGAILGSLITAILFIFLNTISESLKTDFE